MWTKNKTLKQEISSSSKTKKTQSKNKYLNVVNKSNKKVTAKRKFSENDYKRYIAFDKASISFSFITLILIIAIAAFSANAIFSTFIESNKLIELIDLLYKIFMWAIPFLYLLWLIFICLRRDGNAALISLKTISVVIYLVLYFTIGYFLPEPSKSSPYVFKVAIMNSSLAFIAIMDMITLINSFSLDDGSSRPLLILFFIIGVFSNLLAVVALFVVSFLGAGFDVMFSTAIPVLDFLFLLFAIICLAKDDSYDILVIIMVAFDIFWFPAMLSIMNFVPSSESWSFYVNIFLFLLILVPRGINAFGMIKTCFY